MDEEWVERYGEDGWGVFVYDVLDVCDVCGGGVVC